MKKGFEWSVNLLVAVILGVVAAGIFWAALSGKTPPTQSTMALNGVCNNDNDCINNLDGSRCLVIYPGDITPFCGCLTSSDCFYRGGGTCSSSNKCVLLK